MNSNITTTLSRPEEKKAGPPIASYPRNDAGAAQAFAERNADQVRSRTQVRIAVGSRDPLQSKNAGFHERRISGSS
jgi:hypothetical protein